jgi:aryl-alcohol dehydrogenase-like predicted oxidoreductase
MTKYFQMELHPSSDEREGKEKGSRDWGCQCFRCRLTALGVCRPDLLLLHALSPVSAAVDNAVIKQRPGEATCKTRSGVWGQDRCP